MELKNFISKLEDLSAVDIVNFLHENNMSFDVFSDAVRKHSGWDSAEKRRNVKTLLKKKDIDAYNTALAANTADAFQLYLSVYPNGNNFAEAHEKIQSLNSAARKEELIESDKNAVWQEIISNPNSVTPDELFEKGITAEDIRQMNIDGITDEIIDAVYRYQKPQLIHNSIPQNPSEIPSGYTDIFFWGIPSSGKTCALATIIDTMKNHYTVADPDIKIKFGATYRHSLDNVFDDTTGIGNLPDRTVEDRTQYMPFLLKTRKEKNYRKISFFELSGEVFKHFYDLTYGTESSNNESQQDKVRIGFETLKLLLNSNNQKIHFFFIDYDHQTQIKKQLGWTQAQHLEAAAAYFRDTNDIFKKKTDAVYVVITKSDEIKGENKQEIASKFLESHFGNFMDVIKTRCRKDSVNLDVMIFSIGKVWFKRICEIDRSYAHNIINELLEKVEPQKDNIFKKFLNS